MSERSWQSLVEALVFLFEDPKGPIFISVADGRENERHIVISPPPSLKSFRESDFPEKLLNAGIPSNNLLSKKCKLNQKQEQMLIDLGWLRPQHPFNNYYSLPDPAGRSLRQMLQFCIDSFTAVYALETSVALGLGLSQIDAEAIDGRFLEFSSRDGTWQLMPNSSNLSEAVSSKLEPDSSSDEEEVGEVVGASSEEPEEIDWDSVNWDEIEFEEDEESSENEEPATRPGTDAPSPTRQTEDLEEASSNYDDQLSDPVGPKFYDSSGTELHVGAQVSFMASNKGEVVHIQGVLIGERDGKALVSVNGGLLPRNDYAIPWNLVSLN